MERSIRARQAGERMRPPPGGTLPEPLADDLEAMGGTEP
jgi:hypothetical protein